jgi:hypothetical protein
VNDETAEGIRNELDAALASAPDTVGIAFGIELFDEFRRRDWFTLETFGALGTSLFAEQLPAYRHTHFVFPTWGVPNREFRVGQNR